MIAKVTPFGRFLRNLRMERGERLLDMAKLLNVTPSYLSAVENGKKAIPQKWLNEISNVYNLSNSQIDEIQTSIMQTQETLEINVSNMNTEDLSVLASFARKFESMSKEEKKKVYDIVKGSDEI